MNDAISQTPFFDHPPLGPQFEFFVTNTIKNLKLGASISKCATSIFKSTRETSRSSRFMSAMNRLMPRPIFGICTMNAKLLETFPLGTRTIIGGYNLDANALDSKVAGPYGRVPRKIRRLPEDELRERKLDDGSVKGLDTHGWYSRSTRKGIHKESFAFQEWAEFKTVISQDFINEQEQLRLAAMEEKEETWKDNMKRNWEVEVVKERKGFPESFHPAPMSRSDPAVSRHPEPLLTRSEMRHIPDHPPIPSGQKVERSSEAPFRELEHLPRFEKS